jgi:chemotaxis protein histidine kinase CheA
VAVKGIVDELAKASVLTDADDLPALVGLQERFQSLSEAIDSEQLASLARAADVASTLLEDIVLRQVEDADAALKTVRQVVEYAHSVIEAVENGQSPDSVRSPIDQPTTGRRGADEIDEEILGVWLTECDHSLSELESTVVEVENAQDPSDLIAEIRRAVHTLKGEAGILSLHTAQRLCHEAESLIDLRSERGGRFPVDELLALSDWMKSYVAALAADPLSPAPAHDELLSRLSNAGEEAAADETRPELQFQSENDEKLPPERAPKMRGASDPVEFPSELVRDENLDDFLCEAREHISNAEESLLELEQNPEDSELINTVFRAFHTIKGVAGFMNLKPIVEVAHTAETLLDQIRNGVIALNGDYMNLILQSCDVLSQLLEVFEGGRVPTRGELRDLVDRLKRATAGEIALPEPVQTTTADGDPLRPLGEILVQMELASEEEITDLLEVQAEGVQRLPALLIEAGVEDVEAAEEALLSGGAEGDAVRDMLVKKGSATVEQIDEAVQARAVGRGVETTAPSPPRPGVGGCRRAAAGQGQSQCSQGGRRSTRCADAGPRPLRCGCWAQAN